MIELNADFSFERDTYGWQLHHWRDGKDKEGKPKRQKTTTYHATLHQVCDAVIDRAAGGCQDMADLKGLLKNTVRALTEYAESKAA